MSCSLAVTATAVAASEACEMGTTKESDFHCRRTDDTIPKLRFVLEVLI